MQLSAQQEQLCAIIEQISLNRYLAAAIQQDDATSVAFWLNEGADPDAFANVRHRASALILITDFYDDDTPYLDEDEQLVKGSSAFVPMPGNTAIMAALLDAGANIHAKYDGGETALMLAVRFSSAAVVTFLLAHGADVNAGSNFDQRPLAYGATFRDVSIVRALLDGGADINAQNRAGLTPLIDAVNHMLISGSSRSEKTENVEELSERGADITVRDARGKTVLDYLSGSLWDTLWPFSWKRKLKRKIMRVSRG